MLALAEYQASLCPNCGRPLAVCSAPDAEGKVQVPPPTRCHVTTAVARAREPYAKSKYPNALMFRPHVAD